jgi:tripartite-type tricarboxylate transporter receptor subunit TctC
MFPHEPSRRKFLQSVGALSGALLLRPWSALPTLADHGPCPEMTGKVVRWIVPFSPGGGYDIYSRLIEPFYEQKIGAEIVIENVSGAGGIVGAITLQQAHPDGLTQGILNAPGLMVAALTGETESPNPATDFTLLGRVVRDQLVWVTGSTSPLQTMEAVLAEAEKRSILFGISEIGSTNFVGIAVASFLLGIDVEYLAGFPGSRETSLAVVRGEVDLASFTFESILDLIEAGDLRPVLQVSSEPISSHPSLEGVPLLGGEDGLVARRAPRLNRDVEEARADAGALVNLLGAGRVIAAPFRLEEKLFRCVEQGLHEALTDPEFEAAAATAKRSLDVARAEETLAELQAAAERAGKFLPIIQQAIQKVRG